MVGGEGPGKGGLAQLGNRRRAREGGLAHAQISWVIGEGPGKGGLLMLRSAG